MTHWKSFKADQRGALALEMPFVLGLILFAFLFPLADGAIAGFQVISAYETLRTFGQSRQYHAPQNVTTWASTTTIFGGLSINTDINCGTAPNVHSNAACVSTDFPKYYIFSTTVTATGNILCNPSCSFPISYSERFE